MEAKRQLNPEKLAKLTSFNDELDEKYGVLGTPKREQFDEESIVWFNDNIPNEQGDELIKHK